MESSASNILIGKLHFPQFSSGIESIAEVRALHFFNFFFVRDLRYR